MMTRIFLSLTLFTALNSASSLASGLPLRSDRGIRCFSDNYNDRSTPGSAFFEFRGLEWGLPSGMVVGERVSKRKHLNLERYGKWAPERSDYKTRAEWRAAAPLLRYKEIEFTDREVDLDREGNQVHLFDQNDGHVGVLNLETGVLHYTTKKNGTVTFSGCENVNLTTGEPYRD